MQRKDFLRNGFAALGLVSIVPLACSKEDVTSPSGNDDTGGSSATGDCTVSPTETAGPFPTKTPSSLVRSDIRDNRTGVVLSVNITILNTNNSCTALQNAIVDIWHCDKDGYYSEYGGTGMQSVDYSNVNFLRGRQTTGTDGLVTFTSVFPGWYAGRAPHIHVHVYNTSGTSLLVTQIAFPEDVTKTVYTTAQLYGYTKGTQDTSNAADNIFSDSLDQELATIAGSISEGYTLTHTVYVAG